jgi:hypothetical protein
MKRNWEVLQIVEISNSWAEPRGEIESRISIHGDRPRINPAPGKAFWKKPTAALRSSVSESRK